MALIVALHGVGAGAWSRAGAVLHPFATHGAGSDAGLQGLAASRATRQLCSRRTGRAPVPRVLVGSPSAYADQLAHCARGCSRGSGSGVAPVHPPAQLSAAAYGPLSTSLTFVRNGGTSADADQVRRQNAPLNRLYPVHNTTRAYHTHTHTRAHTHTQRARAHTRTHTHTRTERGPVPVLGPAPPLLPSRSAAAPLAALWNTGCRH